MRHGHADRHQPRPRAPRHGLRPCRRPRLAPQGADRQAGQAGGILRRQEPDHRFRAVECHQLRHSPDRRRHPVQGAQPDPAPAARLELLPPGAQRELRHPARLATHLGDPVVSRHRRCGDPEHRHHPELRSAPHADPGGRSRLQDGLRADARAARRLGRRRHGRLHRGAAHRRIRLRRHAHRHERPHRLVPGEAREAAGHARQARSWRSPAWASTCSSASFCSSSCGATPTMRTPGTISAATSFPIS